MMVHRHADRLRRIAILAALAKRATPGRAREILDEIDALAWGRKLRDRLTIEAAFLTANSLAAAAEYDWERFARFGAKALMAGAKLAALHELTTEEATAVAVPRRHQ